MTDPYGGHLILSNERVLEALYVDAGWTLVEIAWAAGCGERTARRAVRGAGIETRDGRPAAGE